MNDAKNLKMHLVTSINSVIRPGSSRRCLYLVKSPEYKFFQVGEFGKDIKLKEMKNDKIREEDKMIKIRK